MRPSAAANPPTRQVLLGLLAWGMAWTALLLWVVRDVPVDNAEQMAWVRSLQWGYHKHPPLPTWLIAPAVQLFGLQAWVPSVMGAVVKLATLALSWDLMRRMFDERRALIGLVCLCGVAYYSARLHFYSHNEVLLLCSAGAAWALWRAWTEVDSPAGWRHWMLCGLFLGLALLAKYQAVTTVASALLFCLWGGVLRDARRLRGLGLAVLMVLLVVSPHALWLATQVHTPLSYAADSSLAAAWGWSDRLRQLALWLVDLLARSAGAVLLLLAVLGWSRRWIGAVPAGGAAGEPSSALPITAPASGASDAWRLLICWAVVPLAFVMGMSLVVGATIRPHWATPMALWIVLMAVAALPRAVVQGLSLPVFLVAAAVVQGLMVAQLLWAEHRAQSALPRWGQPMVQRWAPALAEQARRELGGDIRVVIAPETVASSLALALEERPYPILDGRLEISPWVPPGMIERCGVLFVVYEPPGPGRRPVQGGPADLIWRVVPPLDGRACMGDGKAP